MQKILLITAITFFSLTQIIFSKDSLHEKSPNTIQTAFAERSISYPQNLSISPGDLQEICQLILDLEILEKYYHFNIPGREVLFILHNNFFIKPLDLIKNERLVSFISQEDIEKNKIENYFIFDDIKIIDDGVVVVIFSYPIEGVKGKVSLRKNNVSEWQIIEFKISEI